MGKSQWISSKSHGEYPGETGFSGSGRIEKAEREWTNWQANLTDKTVEEGRKVVKIASGADFLLALRASGEVWACSVAHNTLGSWIYVSLPISAL